MQTLDTPQTFKQRLDAFHAQREIEDREHAAKIKQIKENMPATLAKMLASIEGVIEIYKTEIDSSPHALPLWTHLNDCRNGLIVWREDLEREKPPIR